MVQKQREYLNRYCNHNFTRFFQMFHQILVVLSLSSLAQGLYDDEFARSKMIGLAVAAHNINMTSQECLDKTFDGDIQVSTVLIDLTVTL